ncbi:MAG: arginine--tRNA ligase, partial [Minisyncoccales bacterium]
MMREKIKEIVSQALLKFQKEENLSFSLPPFEVSFPLKKEFGHYSLSLPLRLSQILKKPALEIAQKLKEKIEGEKENFIFEKIEVALPGFLNFFLSDHFLLEKIDEFLKNKGQFRFSRKKKRVFIDYFSPNIAKRPSVSHLRSLLIGHSLSKIFALEGYSVFACNYWGDWGTQFGNLLFNIKRKKIKIKDLTLEKMEELYVDFHLQAKKDPTFFEQGRLWFLKLEKGEREALIIWRHCQRETKKKIK